MAERDSIARLNQTRRDERKYSKILCSFIRSLDEHQKKQETREKQERALSESELVRRQVEEEVLAGVEAMGVAHELADSAQEQESSANESCLVKKIESDARAKERYRLAMANLNAEKMKQLRNKRTELVHPPQRFSQESTFDSIEKAIQNKIQQKRDPASNLKPKARENEGVRKYTLSYINVYSATNKYEVKKNGPEKGVKAIDAAMLKNAETQQKEADFALRREERLERARLRGKHADHVNRMEKDRKTILKELSFTKRKICNRSRKLDPTKPLNPPFIEKKSIERRKQRELETQFEKLFIPDQESGECSPTEEKAFIGQTKLRDLISQQRELCSELRGSCTDDSVMTSPNNTTSPHMSVYAISETDITM